MRMSVSIYKNIYINLPCAHWGTGTVRGCSVVLQKGILSGHLSFHLHLLLEGDTEQSSEGVNAIPSQS